MSISSKTIWFPKWSVLNFAEVLSQRMQKNNMLQKAFFYKKLAKNNQVPTLVPTYNRPKLVLTAP